MEPDVKQKLDNLEKKIDAIYVSTEKTRKYFLWTLIITVAMVVLPMVGLIIVIPIFLSNIQSLSQGLL